jgi:hypothetical protein
MTLCILVLLAVSKIDHEYLILFFTQSHEEVVRLDVVVDESPGMHPLDAFEYLVRGQEDGLEGERTLAVTQQLLEGRAVDVSDQCAEVILDAVPVEVGDAHSALHNPVELGLTLQ